MVLLIRRVVQKEKKSSEIESHGICIYFIDLLYLLVDESNSIYYYRA